MFMIKYRFNSLPSVFDNFFVKNENIHSHNTRNKNLYRTPLLRLDLRKRTIRATGVRVYNYISQFITLDANVKCSISNFKTCLKALIIDNDISLSSM